MYITSTGWEPNEELFAAGQLVNADKTDYRPMGKADDFGLAPPFKVMLNTRAEGINRVWLKNKTEQVELLLVCQNNICKEQDNLAQQ